MLLLIIIGCHGNQNAKKITKNTFKNLLLWNHWSDWAQILHVASLGLGNESLFFYENRPICLVAMAT